MSALALAPGSAFFGCSSPIALTLQINWLGFLRCVTEILHNQSNYFFHRRSLQRLSAGLLIRLDHKGATRRRRLNVNVSSNSWERKPPNTVVIGSVRHFMLSHRDRRQLLPYSLDDVVNLTLHFLPNVTDEPRRRLARSVRQHDP
jgi:hypothetical protein